MRAAGTAGQHGKVGAAIPASEEGFKLKADRVGGIIEATGAVVGVRGDGRVEPSRTEVDEGHASRACRWQGSWGGRG